MLLRPQPALQVGGGTLPPTPPSNCALTGVASPSPSLFAHGTPSPSPSAGLGGGGGASSARTASASVAQCARCTVPGPAVRHEPAGEVRPAFRNRLGHMRVTWRANPFTAAHSVRAGAFRNRLSHMVVKQNDPCLA